MSHEPCNTQSIYLYTKSGLKAEILYREKFQVLFGPRKKLCWSKKLYKYGLAKVWHTSEGKCHLRQHSVYFIWPSVVLSSLHKMEYSGFFPLHVLLLVCIIAVSSLNKNPSLRATIATFIHLKRKFTRQAFLTFGVLFIFILVELGGSSVDTESCGSSEDGYTALVPSATFRVSASPFPGMSVCMCFLCRSRFQILRNGILTGRAVCF